jgi:hypothetical protein
MVILITAKGACLMYHFHLAMRLIYYTKVRGVG